MKKLIGFILCMLVASSADAAVWAVKVCDAETLAASTTTDCDVIDLNEAEYFSYQFRCNSASTTITVSLDWIAGADSTANYLSVPTGMSQLRTAYTTESTTTWSAVTSFQPPVSRYGTLRFTNNASTADVICNAIVILGN